MKQDRSLPTAEVTLLLHYVPILVRSAHVTPWERAFCISIAGRIKRGTFHPSGKQITVLRRLVAAFNEATRDDALLIEGSHEDGQ